MTDTWLDLPDLWEEATDDPVDSTDDGFCHVLMEDGKPYCGAPEDEGGPTCQPYDGEAICPSCGQPTCPTCAVMSSLKERLEES